MEHADIAGLRADFESGETAEDRPPWRRVELAYEHQKQEVVAVWDTLSSATQTTVTAAAGIGAVGGLLIGLILPYVAASIQSTLVGSTLIFFSGLALAYIWMPETMAKVPDFGPRGPLVVIGLITVHGIGIQWTLSRRRADR
jgi:hypothetical protein